MNDDLIIQKFITDKNKINSHYKQIINKDQQIKEYLDNRYRMEIMITVKQYKKILLLL